MAPEARFEMSISGFPFILGSFAEAHSDLAKAARIGGWSFNPYRHDSSCLFVRSRLMMLGLLRKSVGARLIGHRPCLTHGGARLRWRRYLFAGAIDGYELVRINC